MSSGVASRFLDILGSDQGVSVKRIVVAALLAAILAVPAYFIYPWQGVAVHAAAAVLGLLAGHVAAGRRIASYEAGLRGSWAEWMRLAASSESVAEIHRKATSRSSRNHPYWLAALLTFLWSLEILLLVVALGDSRSAAFSIPVLALNGMLTGTLLGYHLRMRSWTLAFRASVGEMVASGEIGLWGAL